MENFDKLFDIFYEFNNIPILNATKQENTAVGIKKGESNFKTLQENKILTKSRTNNLRRNSKNGVLDNIIKTNMEKAKIDLKLIMKTRLKNFQKEGKNQNNLFFHAKRPTKNENVLPFIKIGRRSSNFTGNGEE